MDEKFLISDTNTIPYAYKNVWKSNVYTYMCVYLCVYTCPWAVVIHTNYTTVTNSAVMSYWWLYKCTKTSWYGTHVCMYVCKTRPCKLGIDHNGYILHLVAAGHPLVPTLGPYTLQPTKSTLPTRTNTKILTNE